MEKITPCYSAVHDCGMYFKRKIKSNFYDCWMSKHFHYVNIRHDNLSHWKLNKLLARNKEQGSSLNTRKMRRILIEGVLATVVERVTQNQTTRENNKSARECHLICIQIFGSCRDAKILFDVVFSFGTCCDD